MDGNRRWAKAKGLPRFKGHTLGAEKAKKVAKWCSKRGIKYLSLYAFSTENWNRPKAEVNFLMSLLEKFAEESVLEAKEYDGRLLFLGDISALPIRMKKAIRKAEEATKDNKGITVNIMLNYGGRAEIATAIKKIIENKTKANEISEEKISQFLYTANIPDPDLIIRTGGEERLSNFLTWQSVYTELYFCKTFWPDFAEKNLDKALQEYSSRQKRLGK
jgi:undecaprenyl diphosphate synthase